MKKLALLFFFLFALGSVFAQQKAVTETGDEVVLYSDGTWKYVNQSSARDTLIPVNHHKFKKDKANTFLLKSKVVDVGFWVNPKLWSFKKGDANESAEYKFQYKLGDLYGMVITEQIQVPLKSFKSIALENGRKAAPDLKVVDQQYRTVNGHKVLFLQMDGTIQGIKFSYYGYYYSDKTGSVQFITYTAQQTMDQYKKVCDDLLNGLVVLN
ncbi:MAG: hypothetical protein JXR71_10555 [Bacteroidales bacterium]|nr:hypothetical protein [Bacteroidales bacterium]